MKEALEIYLVIGVVVVALGAVIGFLTRQFLSRRGLRAAHEDAQRLIEEALTRERETILAAKEEALRIQVAAEAENRERRADLQRLDRRLGRKEENLDRKSEALDHRERALRAKEEEAASLRAEIEDLRANIRLELEHVSGLSSEEAKDLLLRAVEDEVRQEASLRAREVEAQLQQEADERAREVVGQAIQRCAGVVVAETTVTVVPLPNDEMKGRIIGREGRNIRALEAATGVDLIVDDTPDAVTLSSFDPVRREVARVALEKLILDGRIHPARIEETVEKARQEVEAIINEEGEKAVFEARVQRLHPELVKILGQLKFRFSYGQNVLAHSLEVSHLAAMMAAEMGANVEVAKRGGLLHDIGKAVDHEVPGPHALIGGDLAHRYGESPAVVEAIAAHHDEREASHVEAALVTAADAISGARPGARRESLDRYLKRLEALEGVATSFPGVEKCYAIQAGREVRVIVKANEVDDLGSVRLARDMVKKIEDTLQYPGQIKVTVVRETRAVEYAK